MPCRWSACSLSSCRSRQRIRKKSELSGQTALSLAVSPHVSTLERLGMFRVVQSQAKRPLCITEEVLRFRDRKTSLMRLLDNAFHRVSLGPRRLYPWMGAAHTITLHICPPISLETNSWKSHLIRKMDLI